MKEVNTSIEVRDNQNIVFTLTASDPDNRPGFDPNADFAIDYQMQYKWDFGDGKTVDWTTQKEMTHNYTGKGSANNGYEYYTVTVMLRDGPEKNPSTLTYTTEPFKVYVNLMPVAEAGPDLPSIDYEDQIQADDLVQFDASGSYDPNDDLNNNNIIDDTEIDNLKYTWDFGDKSAAGEGQKPTHTYTKGGVYTVQLTVFDLGGRTSTDSMTVTVVEKNKAPVLVVDVYSNEDKKNKMVDNQITVMTKEDIMFDASGSYDPDGKAYNDDKNSTLPSEDLMFKWEFTVNGTTSTFSSIYSYPDNGEYTVTLTITDKSHTRKISISQTFTVTVKNRAPFAMINKMETEAVVGQEVIFNGKDSYDADGTVKNWSWEFGDDIKEPFKESSTAMHKYEKPGKYVAKLLVKDDDGDVSTAATINVTIKKAPTKGDDGLFGPGFEVAFAILALVGAAAIVEVARRRKE
jgi:PKD repeat protein